MWADLAEQFAGPKNDEPPLPEKLASVINNLFENKLPEEKSREFSENYKCPMNVKAGSPQVNPEIWHSLIME